MYSKRSQDPWHYSTRISARPQDEGLQIGANGFIRKPVDFEELLEKVEEFC